MPEVKLSAVIITLNEERSIGRCLQSLQGVADEIVVVDSFSTDKTEEACKRFGVKFIRHPFEGHIQQKNYAMQAAANDFILSLDADEMLSEELKKSILQVKKNWRCDCYDFNRLTNYCGQWIRHCGWYPDRKIRLWDRRKGKWGGMNPHDKVVMSNNTARQHLEGDLLHYSYYTIDEHVRQQKYFSEIASQEMLKQGRKATVFHIALNPLFTFIRKYLLHLGFLDGYYGFVISVISAKANYWKYSKLRKLRNSFRS